MKAFADLYAELDQTKAEARIDALERYLERANAEDAAWAVHLLSGHAPKRPLTAHRLYAWVRGAAGVPEWLLADCRRAVGDVAETLALLVPAAGEPGDASLRQWIEERLLPLEGAGPRAQRRLLAEATAELDERQLLVAMKLVTGGLRAVPRRLLIRALARVSGVDAATLAHRLTVPRPPTAAAYRRLLAADTADAETSRPYPFQDFEPLADGPESLGAAGDWRADWWWDGLRAQLVRRRGRTFLWSRGDRLLDGRFAELEEAGAFLPDGTVLDGEIVAWRGGRPLGAAALARRLGPSGRSRKVTAKMLRETPAVLVALDLLALEGGDLRRRPLDRRSRALTELLEGLPAAAAGRLRLAPALPAATRDEVAERRAEARGRGAAGLVLRRRAAPYGEDGAGRLWPAEPLRLAAVLIYAERGSGSQASLYCEYTFGLWRGDELVPFAKTGAGLDDAEVRRLDAFVRRRAVERYGPVRAVAPELVFEIAFDGVDPAPRRKSGLAARAPRIVRRLDDASTGEADDLDAARALLGARR